MQIGIRYIMPRKAYLTSQFGLLSTFWKAKLKLLCWSHPPYIWNWGLVGGTATVVKKSCW